MSFTSSKKIAIASDYIKNDDLNILENLSSKTKNMTPIERLVIFPYKKLFVKNKINIFTAPTGLGKTYAILHELIPYEISNDINFFIIAAPTTDLRDSIVEDAKFLHHTYHTHTCTDRYNLKIQKNIRSKKKTQFIVVVTDLQEIIDHNFVEKPNIVFILVTTLQNIPYKNKKNDINKEDLLIDFIKKHGGEKVCLFWDEIHFSGSSNEETVKINSGNKSGSKRYKGSNYKAIEKLVDMGVKSSGFTATPLKEQRGLLPGISEDKYVLLSNKELWPTTAERIEIGSQFDNILLYPDKDHLVGLDHCITNFMNFSVIHRKRAEVIENKLNTCDIKLSIIPLKKTIMMVSVGGSNIKSGLNVLQTVEEFHERVQHWNYFTRRDFYLATVTQDSISIHNGNHEKKKISYRDLQTKLKDDNDPLSVVIFIEKLKCGINIPNITHIGQFRNRNGIKDLDNNGIPTESILQIFGRGVRGFFGFEQTKGMSSLQAKSWLENIAKNKNIPIDLLDLIRKHMLYSNSHNIFSPDNPIHKQAIQQWTDTNCGGYAAPLSKSLFFDIKTTIKNFSPSSHNSYDITNICSICGKNLEEIAQNNLSNSLGSIIENA